MTDLATQIPGIDSFNPVRAERLRPLTALRAFQRLVRNKDDTAQVFEIMKALNGRSTTRGYQKLLGTFEGGRQAYLREELAQRLDDPEWLTRFPEGSVGAAYRAFREATGFTADGLVRVEREVVPFIDAEHPTVWYSRRLRDVHDIWHVLTGFEPDALGEACVVAFSYGQTGSLGFALIGWGAAGEIRRENRAVPARRAVWQAWQMGRRAEWLPGLDYEALFARPLDEARRRLRIGTPDIYLSVPVEVRRALKLRA
ncbi:Coq4 family protein [Brevundimonas sp.]|uniref:Coq4 family protein n=1 Tax=Brevundimonas sp. TaxID=1871086 RepID=UPI001D25220E|nr:Coq4 family protein [Brevundimonas sp.]MBL0947544.1 ubiquinone biosynthesis protein [Brevundimonas sp.]